MVGNSLTGAAGPITTHAPAARIFLSYRRHDPNARIGRLYDRLVNRFGPERVFIDVDSAVPAENFERVIDRALSASRVLIAVIGPTWETVTDPRGERRLDNPDDYVRYEVAKALENDECAVLPVLWGIGTMMPAAENLPEDLRPLVKLQAIRIDDDDERRHFDFDAEQVMTAVARLLGEPESHLGPDIVLTPPDLVMDPGHAGHIAVVARNVDAMSRDVALRYDGPEWAQLGADSESHDNGRELRNSLTVSPPRRADLPPRAWPYAIELRDRRRERPLAQASGTLTTVAFRDTHVHLEPTRVETRRLSLLSLTVRNGGNVPLHGRVDTKAESLGHESPEQMTLQPGAEETYEIAVTAPRRLVGRAVEHPVTVTVAVQGERDRHVRRATVRQRPLLPARTFLLVATVLVVLLGLGVWRALDAEARRFPSLVGLPRDEALALLAEAGFDSDSVKFRDQDADQPGGPVIVRTDPEAGERISADNPIQLYVGAKSSLKVVPEVAGMTEAEATDALRQEGFTGKLTITEQVTTEAEPGEVIETDPGANEEVLPTAEIEIFVGKADPGAGTTADPGQGDEGGGSGGGSNGEAQTYAIPDVTGWSWEDAEDALEDANFVPTPADEPSDTVDQGLVIRTDPEHGTSHPADTNVIVVVSTGPSTDPKTSVPEVTNQDRAAAEALLSQAGLGPVAQEVETCDAAENQVIAQNPDPGAEVDPGSTVMITVARQPEDGCGGEQSAG